LAKKRITESRLHQDKAFQEINGLVVEERQGKKITLSDNTKLTEFISCSYLGLDQDKRVIEASVNNVFKCGVNFPVARTRLRVKSFVILEELLNQLFGNSYTTVFTSMHLIHLGILPLLGSGEMPSFPMAHNGPLFLLDKTVHSSVQVIRGILEQFGPVILKKFQFLDEVKQQFQQAKANGFTPIAIADGIGSMGGLTSIKELFDFAEKYHGYVYLDDAHGTSIYGNSSIIIRKNWLRS
jgi:7-keto-8-aminopelargonate synthetase-like enzyme